jgi:uncharacterized protein
MNPFFFGNAVRALYGTYHPPQARAGSDLRGAGGVVLCGPFGVEYMRSHRAFRQLTTLLARAGLHVLRFDYGGTGDSAGEGQDQRLEDWVGDVRTAVEELRETAGIDEVSVVGLRLGAILAVEAARTPDTDGPGGAGIPVRHLVLWDPVAEGDAWLREILGGADGVARTAALFDSPGAHAPEGPGNGGEAWVGVSGFPLSRDIFEALRGRVLEGKGLSRGLPVDVVVSADREDYAALNHRLNASGAASSLHVVPSEGNWAEGDAFGSALLPQGIIQALVALLSGGKPDQASCVGPAEDRGGDPSTVADALPAAETA